MNKHPKIALAGEDDAAEFYSIAMAAKESCIRSIDKPYVRQLLGDSLETTIVNTTIRIQTGEKPFELDGEPAARQIRAYVKTCAIKREDSMCALAEIRKTEIVSIDDAINPLAEDGAKREEFIDSGVDTAEQADQRAALTNCVESRLREGARPTGPIAERITILGGLYERGRARVAGTTLDARIAQIMHRVAGRSMTHTLRDLGYDGPELERVRLTARNWPRAKGHVPEDFATPLTDTAPRQGTAADLRNVSRLSAELGLNTLADDLEKAVARVTADTLNV